MPLTRLSVLFSLLLICSCARQPQGELQAIFDEAWEFQIQEYPLFATSIGRHEFNDRLPSVTPADRERRLQFWTDVLARLNRIDRGALAKTDRINYDLFRREVEDNMAGMHFHAYTMPLNADSGFHTGFARLAALMPFSTVKDYENYIARLRAFPRYVGQQIANMKEGIEIEMTLPQVVLRGIEGTLEPHIVTEPEESVLYQPFARFPASVPQSARARLVADGKAAIMDGVVPGYRMFLQFMTEEYIPQARPTIAASDLPGGREYYQQRVDYYTTLALSVEEIHQTGLREVERIRKEMQEIIEQVGFRGDFAAFLKFLRTDPRFYPRTAEELLKEASTIAKRMDGKLPSLFKTFPRLPYGVAPVPDHIAPKYTAGRYVEPALGSTEPGYYWVNTYNLASRPLYVLEALTFHEAVPGHHFQISLARELENVPTFRRFSYISAFGEGWGLYSEWLGLEAGFYTDPYSNFGRLTYEMWRACRLVVDTGIHAMGWTRKHAIDYLAANTALSLHEVRTETDRYISWPGQALSYKMGELEIKELRRKAEDALGEDFDVREFHDVVLRNGAVTLPILEQEVQEYIQKKAAQLSEGT
ncbi:MAG: DUF885 family protein [bacterium]